MVTLNECKTKESQNKLQQLHWKELEKEYDEKYGEVR